MEASVSVVVRYFDDQNNQALGSFMEDFLTSYDSAVAAGDNAARLRIRALWLNYLEGLGALSASQFLTYFAARQIWRVHAQWQVVKTPDTPCVAYTAQINLASGGVSIYALGVAYTYPRASEDAWWNDVILPRVRSF
jgi:hypothetical protein